MSLTTKEKVAKFSFLNEKSYNKTAIDINFGMYKSLSTLKSDIRLGLVAFVNYHFFGLINLYVYLIEVNNCIAAISGFTAKIQLSKKITFPYHYPYPDLICLILKSAICYTILFSGKLSKLGWTVHLSGPMLTFS